jgi:hypothetical protein
MIRTQFHSRPFICAIAVAVSLTALHDVRASPREADIAGNAASGPETTKQAECVAAGPNRRCRIAMIILGERHSHQIPADRGPLDRMTPPTISGYLNLTRIPRMRPRF